MIILRTEKFYLTVRPFTWPVHEIALQCLDKVWTGIQAILKYVSVRHLVASTSSNTSH